MPCKTQRVTTGRVELIQSVVAPAFFASLFLFLIRFKFLKCSHFGVRNPVCTDV